MSVHLARSVLFLFPPSSAVLSLQVNFELAHHRFPAALRRPALPSISPSSIPFTITICSHINQRQTRPDLRSYSPSASVVARRIQQQQVFATPILRGETFLIQTQPPLAQTLQSFELPHSNFETFFNLQRLYNRRVGIVARMLTRTFCRLVSLHYTACPAS